MVQGGAPQCPLCWRSSDRGDTEALLTRGEIFASHEEVDRLCYNAPEPQPKRRLTTEFAEKSRSIFLSTTYPKFLLGSRRSFAHAALES
jgi:hypothetical protein